ncbi:hypothetical protein B5M47_00315 [candidate division CPR3 bacterium 4484_211]|uniref:Four helix bundle protein n=1 Tax=candidate division CPR3 bacterium 4484_211 TaxID=1968527 RepID=A0A1W9NZW6_UNCC3|nr:MAG: hypothetical protein B5M47_00315 [candidate division CPR3 bacterium 4484_211]
MQPYKKLFTYWYSLIIYDLTVKFCNRWIRSWKLREQMNGAARSGKQNIVEGSEGMATSLKTGIKLTNVAKASIEELLGDLEDFLRQRGLTRWSKDDQRVKVFRGKAAKLVSNLSSLSNLRLPAKQVEEKQRKLLGQLGLPRESEEAANLLLTLCHQATYLLNKQVKSLEKKHQTEGGYSEKLYQRRIKYRKG